MIKLKNILKELRGGKTLSVFDADDTLIHSDHWIFITHKDGKKSKLDPAQFAVYVEKPGDVFDFSDFSSKLRNPKIIKKNVALLKKQLEKARKTTARRVVILTARSIGLPVRSFFKTLGMNVEVVAVGSSDPQKKAEWIEGRIKRGYTKIYFMDDSMKNVKAVAGLQKKYPDVTIQSVKV